MIASGVDHTKITVRHVSGYGLNPNVYGRAPGRFFTVENFDSADLENNYLESTAGIYMLNYVGDHTTNETVTVKANRALDIDGRKSDGNGGWLDFNTRTRKSDGVHYGAIRVAYIAANYVVFDWSYQSAMGNVELSRVPVIP